MNLLVNALVKYLAGFALMAALIFVPAGTVSFMNGWLLMVLLFVPMLFLGIYLYVKAPELLKKRLNTREKQSGQKWVVGLSGLLFVASFVVAGLDHRFGWTEIPKIYVGAGAVVLLLSYMLYAEVMKENAYLSRTIEVQEGQKVIDTGLYGIVRHPMYTATVMLFLCMPVVLGSLFALMIMLFYPVLIFVRIVQEEKYLEEHLDGYYEYELKVRYRLLPHFW